MKMYKCLHSMILFVLLIASITFNMASFAQTDVDKIDELINRYHKISKFNGCILVAEKGKIIYENALGFANADQTEKLTLEHSFRLASVSKQFTAMAIVILKERGKIGYQDDVRKYIPEFPFKSITIRHLLTHTSGLPSYSVLLDQYWDTTNAGQDEREVASNKNALKLLVEHQPTLKFNPGDRYEYCNTGYMLLALIVARISNQSFQEFMKHNIFQPLGMVNTYVNEPTGILPEKKRAHGLKPDPEGEGFIPYDYHYQNGMFGDGGIISNIKDMFKWDQALYTEQLVSKPTLDEAFSPTILNDSSKINYGFGWSIIPVEEGMIVAHGGGWLGFNSFILREITRKITIIQLYNMPGIPKDDLAFTIYDILSGRDYFLPIREQVTFYVDMRIPIRHHIFKPWNGDQLMVWGSFNRWDGNAYLLRDLDQDSIYIGKYDVFGKEGEKVEYKYVIEKQNGDLIWEEKPNSKNPPYGNRLMLLVGNPQFLPIANFNHNLKIYKHPLLNFEFMATENWQPIRHPEDNLIYEIIDPDSIKHVLPWYTETEQDAQHFLWKMLSMKNIVVKKKPSKSQIGTYDAWMINAFGYERNISDHIIIAVIPYGKSQVRARENRLFIIQVWCPEENYNKHKSEIEDILKSIKITN